MVYGCPNLLIKHSITTLPLKLQETTQLMMSMALLSLQQPASFLPQHCMPPMPFNAWIHMFENYILTSNQKDLSTARKHALLIHCLGAEEQHIFSCRWQLSLHKKKKKTSLCLKQRQYEKSTTEVWISSKS